MPPLRRDRTPVRIGVLLLSVACADGEPYPEHPVRGGDADEGERLVQVYGCAACHEIPDADLDPADVGPPLTDWSERHYIAGRLTNTPPNLIRWIVDPDSVEPGTAMPDLGVRLDEARHLAAYLFTLGGGRRPPTVDPAPASWQAGRAAERTRP